MAYNKEHGITPQTIQKAIRSSLHDQLQARETARKAIHASESEYDRGELLATLEREMLEAAEALEFEKAARLRDRIDELKAQSGGATPATPTQPDEEPEDTKENWTYIPPKKTMKGTKRKRTGE